MEESYRIADCPRCSNLAVHRRRSCFHCVGARRRARREGRKKVWCDWCGGAGWLQGIQACRDCLGAGRIVVSGPSREAVRAKQLQIATPVMVRERQWQRNSDIFSGGA